MRETLCDIFQIPDQDLGLLGVGMAALGGTLLSETELRALSRSSLSRASLQSGGLRTPGHPAGLLRTPGGHFQTQGELVGGSLLTLNLRLRGGRVLSPKTRERANEMVVVARARGQLAYCEGEGAKIQRL